jgi:chromosome partitioning protein
MSFVIAITNRKGGTGKSTTTVNLAAEFAARGKKTVVIDLDTQAHATLGLGFSPNKNSSTVHSLFCEPGFSLGRALVKTKWDNLFLIPANPMFEHGKVLNNRTLREALLASDYILIPFLPHFLSIEGIKSLARVFLKIASKENPSLKLLGLVPVMINRRIQQHKKVTENVSNQFGENKVFPGIRTDIKLVEAFEAHTPIKFHSPGSRGAIDYETLANEVLEEIYRRLGTLEKS